MNRIQFSINGGVPAIEVMRTPTQEGTPPGFLLEVVSDNRRLMAAVPEDTFEALARLEIEVPNGKQASIGVEIERKFLVHKDVPLEAEKQIHATQSYLLLGKNFELRIRQEVIGEAVQYWLTVKMGSGMTRRECDLLIPQSTYQTLIEQSRVTPLRKVRDLYPVNGLLFEVDSYPEHPELQGLRVVEVEFSSESDANAFSPPPWFGEEVTEDPQYKNCNLWGEIQNRLGNKTVSADLQRECLAYFQRSRKDSRPDILLRDFLRLVKNLEKRSRTEPNDMLIAELVVHLFAIAERCNLDVSSTMEKMFEQSWEVESRIRDLRRRFSR